MVRLTLDEYIETDRLLIQRLKYEDAEEIFFTYASKPEVTKYLSWPTHQSVDDTRAFLNYAHEGWKEGKDYSFSLRLKENGNLIGSFGIMNDNGKLQFGYTISPSKSGQGYASETVIKMMSLVRGQEGVYRIGTFVDVENIASQKVLIKAGLIEEAYLSKWFRFVNQNNTPKDCLLFKLPL